MSAAAVKIEPAKTRMIKELKYTSPLVGCRFDCSGKYVFASAQDSTVQRLGVEDGQKTALTGHRSWVRALASTRSPALLWSGDYTGKILAWPVEGDSPTPTLTLEAHQGWVRALAVSPDGKLLASCGNDNAIRLWSIPDGKPVRELTGHESHVYGVVFHPSGEALASTDLKGVVKVWDLARGTQVRDLDASVLHKYDPTFRADIGGVRGMVFSPDGSTLACAGITNVSNAFAGVGNPLVVLFDWKTGKRSLLKPAAAFRGTAWGVVWHPQGYVIAAGGGQGGELWFWKPDQEKSIFTLKLPNNARDIDLHPDGTRLAVACYDSTVRIYDMTPPSKK